MSDITLPIDIYADGANPNDIVRLAKDARVAGFTTNPSLMRAAGIQDYASFAHDVAQAVHPKPVSFEVFADDHEGMERQARYLCSLGQNIYVKIPITNTQGLPSAPVIARLLRDGIKVNVTAVFTLRQIRELLPALRSEVPAIVSVFAGRIADAGIDPVPLVSEAVALLSPLDNVRVLWASSREIFNVIQAAKAGCHIITLTMPLLAKLPTIGRDLEEFSLATVRSFHRDAMDAGYHLPNCSDDKTQDPARAASDHGRLA